MTLDLSADAIHARGLRKRFRNTPALDGVNLVVPRGAIVGVTGSNGAGKTTLLRILATLLGPDAGTATVNGFDVVREGDSVRRSIGAAFVNERAVYWRLSGRANLMFFARLAGLPRRDARAAVERAIDAMTIAAIADRRVSTYSAGQRQRLILARATIAEPAVLLLDEPLRGLDDEGTARVREHIVSHARRGAGVVVAGPTLDGLDDLCDDVIRLQAGAVVARETVAQP